MKMEKLEKELFRAKAEDFQSLLDYKKSIKGSLGGGALTTRYDTETGEYVLIHRRGNWAANIIESSVKMGMIVEDFEKYLAEEGM